MTTSLAQSLAPYSPQRWAIDFLKGIGAPVTQPNINFVVSWEAAESGGGGGRFNPLNSVLGAPGATNLNSVGVKNYVTYAQGIKASVATFTQTQWAGVVNALRANNQSAAATAINAEYATWGGGPIRFGPYSGATSPAHGAYGDPSNLGVPGGDPTSSAAAGDYYGCPDGKLWEGPAIPGAGRLHLTRCEGRAMLGVAALGGGVLLMLVGFGFLAIGGRGAALTRLVA